jgi:hypothetical protein
MAEVSVEVIKINLEKRSLELNIKDGKVDEKSTYSLLKPPSFDSALVQKTSVQDILKTLRISSLVSDLANAVDLTFLAYNALAMTQVQSKVSALQKSLLDVFADSIVTVGTFAEKSEEVIESIIKIHNWLFDGKENLAVIELKLCGEIAQQMANDAQKLAKQFEGLFNDSQTLSAAALTEQGSVYQKREQMQAKLRELETKQAEASAKQKKLEQQYNASQKDYLQALEREGSLSERYESCPTRTVSDFASFFRAKPLSREPLKGARQSTSVQLELKESIASQSQKNLAELASYVSSISKLGTDILRAEVAIEIFHYAVQSIAEVVVSLNSMRLFWYSIETYCESLKTSQFVNHINNIARINDTTKRTKLYYGNKFMLFAITNLSDWVALDQLYKDYLIELKGAYNQLSSNIEQASIGYIALDKAQELANKILYRANRENEMFSLPYKGTHMVMINSFEIRRN